MGYSPWGCKESDMTEATLHARQLGRPPKLISLPTYITPSPLLLADMGTSRQPLPGSLAMGPAKPGPHPDGRCCTEGRSPIPSQRPSH